MKTLIKPLMAAIVACLFGCSEDLDKPSYQFSALIGSQNWLAEEVVAEARVVEESSRIVTLTATHKDNSKIDISFELLGITPDNLSSSFRKKGAVISSFTGAVNNGVVTLNWTTSSETDVQYFEVYRSYDNSWYDNVNWIWGNGTTNVSHDYVTNVSVSDFYDVAYFKLRVIDYMSNDYSEVLQVKLKVGVSFTDASGQKLAGYDGRVTVTDYDLENKRVSGTFNFKYKTLNGNEKVVTNGVFTDVAF